MYHFLLNYFMENCVDFRKFWSSNEGYACVILVLQIANANVTDLYLVELVPNCLPRRSANYLVLARPDSVAVLADALHANMTMGKMDMFYYRGVRLASLGLQADALTSKYSAMCSQASSNWFSSNITSNMSCGHWANFSAATICTFKFFD